MSIEVPEAWSLDRIREVVDATSRGKDAAALGLSDRHVRYHLQAARVLGWAERAGRAHVITALGRRLLATRVGSAEETALFRESIAESPLVKTVLPKLLIGMDRAEIIAKLISHPETKLARETAEKRSGYLVQWIDRLRGLMLTARRNTNLD